MVGGDQRGLGSQHATNERGIGHGNFLRGRAAGIIPWWITRWQFRPPFLGLELTRAIGVVLIIDSFARFALQGLGTRLRLRRHKSWW